jgi:endo-1,4-beta-xylanase
MTAWASIAAPAVPTIVGESGRRRHRRRRHRRRGAAASLAFLVFLTAIFCSSSATSADMDTPLRTLAAYRGMQFGTAVAEKALADDADYRALVGTQFSQVTPEVALKWSAVEPAPGFYDFTAADRLVDFAQRNGQAVRGHTLVWHRRIPGWIEQEPPTQLADSLRRHIDTLVGRYRGRMDSWDVVNEPLNEDGTLRQNLWLEKLGPDYIGDSLRRARAADPHAKLYINEYGAEAISAKSNALFRLVQSLKNEGVPIDGVGFEFHIKVGGVPTSLAENLKRFLDLGVSVTITELDDRVPVPASSADLRQQAIDYAQVVTTCAMLTGCTGVTVWGATDRFSWIDGYYPGWGAALLWDRDGRRKPATQAVSSALRS